MFSIVFDLGGQGQISEGGAYQINGQITSNDETPLAMKDVMSMARGGMGSSADAPASMTFNHTGQF